MLRSTRLLWFTVGLAAAISPFVWRNLLADRYPISSEAKTLAEKNQLDLPLSQTELAERHRIAETLDIEINRWAAGKEGNLRALLSTLQHVVWPECGWQPISLTDLNLITGTAVKKLYRKATLCIHPDKVVKQKGVSLEQQYIAEKVFDLHKEAWNKSKSEEHF